MNVKGFIWPYVGSMPVDDTLKDDLDMIKAASWGNDTPAFLDEARRLRDIETSRKTSAETKSQIYLAVLLALIPILVSLTESNALKGIMNFSIWYQITGFILFVLGIAYGIGAFIASFRALTVRAYHRIDVDEIISSGATKAPLENITKKILETVRRDRSNINFKISYVIVTHALIFRMALLLLLALSLTTFGPILDGMLIALKDLFC